MEGLFGSIPTSTSPRARLQESALKEADLQRERQLINAINTPPVSLFGKKPWEMTREAWETLVKPIGDAYNVRMSLGIKIGDLFLKKHGYTHNGYFFRPGSVSNSRHEVQVAYALLRGDDMPAEVLDQYPKSYWASTFDLARYVHHPRYVTSEEECLAAISQWEKDLAHANECLAMKAFQYQSERDWQFFIEAYARIIGELRDLLTKLGGQQEVC